MKKTLSGVAGVLFIFTATAQVQIDQPIQLTGGNGQRKVTQLEAPVAGTDAVNKDYVDNAVAATGGGGPTMITDESSATMNYGDAIRYCHNLNESGHTDWRLPTYIELVSTLSNGSVTVPNPSSANYIHFIDPQGIFGNSGFVPRMIRLSDGSMYVHYYYETPAGVGRVRCVR